MAEIDDFEKWQDEINDAEVQAAQEREYIRSLPTVRPGKWSDLEYYDALRKDSPMTSLQLAQSIQRAATSVPRGYRMAEIIKNQGELDARAHDVRGLRANIGMHDGSYSAVVGGYSIMSDEELIALRLHEIASAGEMKAARHGETGLRFTGPLYVPVLAVCSFALLSR